MLQVDLLDMLYQKSLRLGVDVRNARGIGTVVNLQSNDASKVWMMPVHIHTLWNSPFQVCATICCTCGAPVVYGQALTAVTDDHLIFMTQ